VATYKTKRSTVFPAMAMIDPEQERARLTEVYSHQTDEQLEEIASHGDELTHVALQSLQAKLSRRGLTNVRQKSSRTQIKPNSHSAT
jgi:hypothetical protein